MRIFIAGSSFLAGIVVTFIAQMVSPPSAPSIPDGYYNLSSLPDDLEEKFANPDYLQRLIQQDEMRTKIIAERKAERAARTPKVLPDGLPDLPPGLQLFEPDENFGWPSFEDLALRNTFEAAKSDWVIVNYWASWCAPCLVELPDMDQAAPAFAEFGIHLLPINADPSGRDTQNTVQDIYAQREVTQLPRLIATNDDISIALEAAGMTRRRSSFPFNVIYAPGGEPFAYFAGFPQHEDQTALWSSEEMLAFLEGLTDLIVAEPAPLQVK